jgi:hypothetical protein
MTPSLRAAAETVYPSRFFRPTPALESIST